MSKNSSIETFFEQNAVDGVLGEEAMAKLLTGDMGDNTAGETPEPAQEGEEKPKQQPEAVQPVGDGKPDEATATGEGEDPVILAKDGKNIIPYEKLIEAREEAKAAKAEAQVLMQEMESIKEQIASLNAGNQQQPQQEAQSQQPPTVDIAQLEREAHEALLEDDQEKAVEIRVKINAELMRQAKAEALQEFEGRQAAKAQATESERQQSLLNDAAAEVVKDYPELDLGSESANKEKVTEVIEYRDFLIASKGIPAHEALKTAAQRIMGAPVKRAGGDTPAPEEKKPPAVTPSVKERTPTTMSDIPAGTAVHTDEAEALAQMSNTALLGKMMNMDPAKIESLISRVV